MGYLKHSEEKKFVYRAGFKLLYAQYSFFHHYSDMPKVLAATLFDNKNNTRPFIELELALQQQANLSMNYYHI